MTTPKVKHRAAILDPVEFGGMLRAIDGYQGQASTRIALKLMAYLFPRPGELRQARWNEFDLEGACWTIPAERAKTRREHRKPLPWQAMELLHELRDLTGFGALAFPATTSVKRPMSENTLNAALRRMGFAKDEVTSHGFRATASTLLNESTRWSRDAIERELGHIEANDVRRAYARGEHMEERRAMIPVVGRPLRYAARWRRGRAVQSRITREPIGACISLQTSDRDRLRDTEDHKPEEFQSGRVVRGGAVRAIETFLGSDAVPAFSPIYCAYMCISAQGLAQTKRLGRLTVSVFIHLRVKRVDIVLAKERAALTRQGQKRLAWGEPRALVKAG